MFYGQDERWEDGCDYNCQCVDASKGHYQCAAKCLTFRDLPPECSVLPAPQGKCCPIINCPQGIVVNYPDGYQPQ
ncbi:collagen alpha-4(vi) chain [Plakobranchus ocellatus]|uniref:Collagen alpha-4(Vi) chain n=1 Tax=Plakobranchus ocellatus TaxID=259542 RepID=A0AAV4AKH5_9GAST|nr:collagen alpha-4(vi) chain [Plakobranchus ocellatus]